jgi:hypothetical protein
MKRFTEHEIASLSRKGLVWCFNVIDGQSHLCHNQPETETICGWVLPWFWHRTDVDPALFHPVTAGENNDITCDRCAERVMSMLAEVV